MKLASEYVVVYAEGVGGLGKQVDHLLKRGWELVGGVSVSVSMGISVFAQALTKLSEEG